MTGLDTAKQLAVDLALAGKRQADLAGLLEECRTVLRDMNAVSTGLNNAQHAGLDTHPDDWSTLYQIQASARSLLARLDAALDPEVTK